jgi:hypothetical protein
MNTIKPGVMVLLTLLISPLMIAQASAESLTTGEIRFRGAIVEAAQCKPLHSPVHTTLPSAPSIQCERSEMASLVTTSMDDDVVVWRYLNSTGKGIVLSQGDGSRDAYRITLSYF